MAATLYFILAVYIALGGLFSAIFLVAGLKVIDHLAADSSFGFKLMILPGTIALWPILLKKWIVSK